MSLLDVEDLTAGIAGSPAILAGVSFAMEAEERVALVGPSGAGKTSLVRLILGLNRPVRRRAGTVKIDGVDLFGLRPRQLSEFRRRTLAFVPQNPASALDPLKTLAWQWRQNLSTIEPAPAGADARRHLERFGISERLDAYPHAWSRGMQQRLLLAMALARRPRLLVLDEPTSALDPIVTADVVDALLRSAREQRTAVLLITHQTGLAAAVAQRRLQLDSGRIVPDTERSCGAESVAPRGAVGSDDDRPQGRVVVRAERLDVMLSQRRVLQGIDIDLHAGRTIAVVGESGAGKSTLVRALIGLTPISGGHVQRWVKHPGLVFQDPLSALCPTMRVDQAIAEPLLARGEAPRSAIARVRTLAAELGLPRDVLSRSTRELSVGQAQRVCIGRAVIGDPGLLVLDEPLSALDRATADDVTELIVRMRRSMPMAILAVTHDLGFARRVADRIIVLQSGRVAENVPAEVFFRQPVSDQGRRLLAAAVFAGDVVAQPS